MMEKIKLLSLLLGISIFGISSHALATDDEQKEQILQECKAEAEEASDPQTYYEECIKARLGEEEGSAKEE